MYGNGKLSNGKWAFYKETTSLMFQKKNVLLKGMPGCPLYVRCALPPDAFMH